MRLTELEPRWLLKDGKRIGFAFKCPNPDRQRKWWMTCFAYPTPYADQHQGMVDAVGDTDMWQPCNEKVGWTIDGGIDAATFDTLTVTPSIDGGESMWHGFIRNGAIG